MTLEAKLTATKAAGLLAPGAASAAGAEASPYAKADGEWLHLTGDVEHAAGSRSTSAADDEDEPEFVIVSYGYVYPLAHAEGAEVRSIDGRELMLQSDEPELQADTGDLGYDPRDDEGYQRLEVGDRVRVTGDFDVGLFERSELQPPSIVTLESMDGAGAG